MSPKAKLSPDFFHHIQIPPLGSYEHLLQVIPPPKAVLFLNSVSPLSRKQQEEKTVNVPLVPHFVSVAVSVRNIPNSFLSFYLCFWIYRENSLRL